MSLTKQAIHERLTTLGDEMQEMYNLIAEGLPKDADGFPKPENPDLADAMKTIENAISVLTRLSYNAY